MLSLPKLSLAAATLAFASAASLSTVHAQTPVKWTATTVKSASAGGQASVKLSAAIESGWHIYSVTQGPGGPIPTKITVPDSQVFSLAGAVKPSEAPETAFDENFGINVETHEKAVSFAVPLKIAKGTKAGSKSGTVAVRYQACNASLCLPPKTERLKVSLTVKGGK